MCKGKDGSIYHHAVLYPRKGEKKKPFVHPVRRGKRVKQETGGDTDVRTTTAAIH